MTQAVAVIAGRTYRMSCEEGEQKHIEDLARMLDARIAALRGSFGDIGEERIVVMAALTISDEFHASQKLLAETKAELEATRTEVEQERRQRLQLVEGVTKALDHATALVAAATEALNRS